MPRDLLSLLGILLVLLLLLKLFLGYAQILARLVVVRILAKRVLV